MDMEVSMMMAGWLNLACAALLVDLAVIFAYVVEKKTRFGKLDYKTKQLVWGVLFGALAIVGTEYGVRIEGATLNVRDAAPLCAGLIFGAPAGLIAGVIGGVERWFAVAWGAGTYTRWACTISTTLAGVFAAALRKHMFDDKKPSWLYGLMIGIVMEVLHMLMIFFTNMNDVHRAFTFVKLCSAPMILFNGLSVMLATLCVSWIGKERGASIKQRKTITQEFQRWLFGCVIIAFCFTCLFTLTLQTRLSYNDSVRLLSLNISDVRHDIEDASDANLLSISRKVAGRLGSDPDAYAELLPLLMKEYRISEIDIVDRTGVITASTTPQFVGYDMASGEQSAEFLVLLGGQTAFVQDYQPTSYDPTIYRKYAGIALRDGGFMQVGYDSERFQQDIDGQVVGVTRNRHIGESGCVIICDENWSIVSDRNGQEGENLEVTGIWIDRETMPENQVFTADVYDEPSLCMYDNSEGYIMVAVLPMNEALFTRDVSVYVMVFMEIILFATLFMMIYFLIKKMVVDNIQRVNRSLSQITDGNLDVLVDVRANEEFASLSDDINSTVVTLKHYIAEAAARIDAELAYARAIQASALPSVFPPYPNRKEFDLYATMDTAKEVGGDFYDFYFVDEDHLAFLVADVSGKGIPAAMFMMTAKTQIKSLAESGMDLAQTMALANEKLCEGNDAGMFVTAWLGSLDVRTGCITFVNAGHNPPLVGHAEEPFAYLKARGGFVLAGMKNSRYRMQQLQLNPGDMIYLYTDGVTEATNAQNELYGEERLLALLNGNRGASAQEMTELVMQDVARFVGDASQFDDITMLALRYRGKSR